MSTIMYFLKTIRSHIYCAKYFFLYCLKHFSSWWTVWQQCSHTVICRQRHYKTPVVRMTCPMTYLTTLLIIALVISSNIWRVNAPWYETASCINERPLHVCMSTWGAVLQHRISTIHKFITTQCHFMAICLV